MTNTQSQPPLLSLKIHRTVEAILNVDTLENDNNHERKKRDLSERLDHSEEISQINGILEQQCFQFTAFRNQIKDTRIEQKKLMDVFHEKVKQIEESLKKAEATLLKKVSDLNKRYDIIARNLTLKPTFRSITSRSDFGRITAITGCGNILLSTTNNGWIFYLDRQSFDIRGRFRFSENEAVFRPSIYMRENRFVTFYLTSAKKLLHGTIDGQKIMCEVCCEGPVESYCINTDHNANEKYDIILGKVDQIEFCTYRADSVDPLTVVASTNRLRGTVSAIVLDNHINAVFVLTSKRMFYSISSDNHNIIYSESFKYPLMQIFVTQCFIIISTAPNDIIVAEKSKEKLNRLYNLTIDAGLRRMYVSQTSIFIIQKDQRIQRRKLHDMTKEEIICEPYAANYDEEEYIGAIESMGEDLYLSHGDMISHWS